MSYIPDTFSKMETNIYGKETGKLNPYWYKILEGKDAEYVAGYDMALTDIDNILDGCIVPEILDIISDDEMTEDEMIEEIRDTISTFLCGNRDEVVVSLIENMSEEDYDRRFEEVKDLPDDEDI